MEQRKYDFIPGVWYKSTVASIGTYYVKFLRLEQDLDTKMYYSERYMDKYEVVESYINHKPLIDACVQATVEELMTFLPKDKYPSSSSLTYEIY